MDRNRYRAQTSEPGAHVVGRVADRRIEHGVELRTAQVQIPSDGADELLGAHARRDLVGRQIDREATSEPHWILGQLRGVGKST